MHNRPTNLDRDWMLDLSEAADLFFNDWVAVRRHLHQHPELSGKERLTTQYLKSLLSEMELPIRVASDGCGLTADLVSDESVPGAPRLGIRGDIDALPIDDEKSVAYHSTVPGVMHACGHDVHATVILAAMQLLHHLDQNDRLPWPIAVRAILQPSEETATGAQHMIDQGALENVVAVLAMHVDPTRRVGRIGLREHVLTANCDLFEVRFRGVGGHGARPHLANDPIDACTRWVQSAYRRISRTVNAHDTVVISVGMIQAGHSANIIPDTAKLSGTLRSLNDRGRESALKMLKQVCDATQLETGCDVELKLGTTAPAVVNDVPLTRLVERVAGEILDSGAIEIIEEPSMGSEDFSYYLRHVPGAMYRLGVAGDHSGSHPLHTAEFDIDEHAIKYAAKLFACTAISFFCPDRS